MLKSKIFSAIQGGLNNLLSSDVPNFMRSTPIWIETILNDSLKIEPVKAYQPAIHPEDSAIILEPAGINLVTHNLRLSESVWIKGSNVRVYPGEVESPDTSTYQGDRIDWGNGEGDTQRLKRTFSLKAGRTYTLSAFLKLPPGEQASDKDVLRCGGATFQLKKLNNYINRYRICEFQFKTAGNQLTLPSYSHLTSYPVGAVTSANTLTLLVTDGTVAANQFLGGQVQFGTSDRLYPVLGNTAGVNGSVTLTLGGNSLFSDGITAGMAARFHGAPDQSVELEFYCESSLSIHFGGIQIEERDFRTSMIYQDEALNVKAASLLSFRRNPIGRLKSFGIFIDLKEWRGDGNIFDAGNLKADINGGKLRVRAGNVVIVSPETLPKKTKIFIQISAENTNISVYVDKVLIARSSIYDFIGDHRADLVLTSEGMRAYYPILFFDQVLLDGQPTIGQPALHEVAELFDSKVILDSTTLATNPPPIALVPLTVPPPLPPLAKTQVRGLTAATQTVTVLDRARFVVGTTISVVREERVVFTTRIVALPANAPNDVQLELAYGVVIGDFLVYGNTDQPGQASARFPYTPIDQARIDAISPSLNRLKVASSLAFTKSRAFVSTSMYEDIAEVRITDKDDQQGFLFVDSLVGLQEGQIISQAEDELILDPDCYDAYLIQQVEGVEIGEKYTNAVKVINRNPVPVRIQVVILPSAY